MRIRTLSTFTSLTALASLMGAGSLPALAQLPQIILIDDAFQTLPTSYEQNQLERLVDRDGDGQCLLSNEVAVTWSKNSPDVAWLTVAKVRVEGGLPVMYWYDRKANGTTNNGAIYRAVDKNNDGAFDPASPLVEVAKFRDTGVLDGSAISDGLALTPDGAVWWSQDFLSAGIKGLRRMQDLNADGDAADAGENVVLIDGATSTFTVATDAGPQSADANDFRRLAPLGNGVLAYVDGSDEAAYAYVDTNADGDLLDAGEARLFLNATGKNAALPINPDFANGTLRSLVVALAPTASYGRLSHVATEQNPGGEAYFLACDSSNTGAFAMNTLGQPIYGLIFRAQDGNGDGDANDAGEVTQYYDGANASATPVFEKVLGIGVDGHVLAVCTLVGSTPAVVTLEDLNGDGDAEDAGEQGSTLFDATFWFGVPPFTLNPFINDIAVAPAGTFNDHFSSTGAGCSQFGQVPVIGFQGQAQLGTSGFSAQILNCPPASPAVLMIGASTTSWLGLPLPLDLAIFGISGCFLYQDVALQLVGFADAAGVASFPLALTNDPTLLGLAAPLQGVSISVTPTNLAVGFTGLGLAEILP